MSRTFGRRNAPNINRSSKGGFNIDTTREPISQNKESQIVLNGQVFGDEPVNEEKKNGRLFSFFWACVVGFTFSVVAMGIMMDAKAPGPFGSHLFLNIAGGFAMITTAPLLLIPARIITDILRFCGVPRGYLEVSVGTLIGVILFVAYSAATDPIVWESSCFIFGGAIGGFAYWRSRGYPGLKKKYNKTTELGFKLLGKF